MASGSNGNDAALTSSKSSKAAAQDAENALWGEQSLKERFGDLQGRELQERLFGLYQAYRLQ